MRAPWIGLPLDEIARLVEPSVAATSARRATAIPLLLRDQGSLAALREDSRARIRRLIVVVDAARAELTSRSIDVVVRSAWLRLGGSTSSPVDALDAEAFFDLIASRARDDLKIEKVEQANNTLKVTYEHADEALLKEKNARVGYVFKITVPASEEIALIRDTIATLRAQGVATLLVEQRVDAALATADRIAFVVNGAVAETVSTAGLPPDAPQFHRYVGI